MLQHPEHREVCSPSERLCGTKARCPGSTDPVTVIKALGEQGNTKCGMRGCLRQGKCQLNYQLPIQHPEVQVLLAASFCNGTKEAKRKSCVCSASLLALCLALQAPAPALQHRFLMIWGRPAELTTQEAKRRIEDLLNYQDLSSEGCSGETRGTSSSPQPSP